MNHQPVIQEHVDLSGLNSLGIAARARYFVDVATVDQLRAALTWAQERELKRLLLGGGSNLVFTGDFDGLVIRSAFAGRQWEDVTAGGATLALGAGENWHSAVLYGAGAGYRGIENLALIPGTTGAAPMQNIGAYGVELKDTLVSVTALDCTKDKVVILSSDDCQFAYRDSIFKHQPGRYIVLEVRLALSRTRPLSLGYGELAEYFSDHPHPGELTPLEVAEGVMAIRRRKLPDPGQLPNAGSFFKNPVVSMTLWDELSSKHPGIVGYPGKGVVKLAAAWLIDQCGWKGYRNDRVGVHNRQALVLINHSGGSGEDILALARRIQDDVLKTYGVALEIEPRIIT